MDVEERIDAMIESRMQLSVAAGLREVTRVVPSHPPAAAGGAGESKDEVGAVPTLVHLMIPESTEEIGFSEEAVDRLRLALVMHSSKFNGSETYLNLSGFKLKYFADLVCTSMRSLLLFVMH